MVCYACTHPDGLPLDHNEYNEATEQLTHFYADPQNRSATLTSIPCRLNSEVSA